MADKRLPRHAHSLSSAGGAAGEQQRACAQLVRSHTTWPLPFAPPFASAFALALALGFVLALALALDLDLALVLGLDPLHSFSSLRFRVNPFHAVVGLNLLLPLPLTTARPCPQASQQMISSHPPQPQPSQPPPPQPHPPQQQHQVPPLVPLINARPHVSSRTAALDTPSHVQFCSSSPRDAAWRGPTSTSSGNVHKSLLHSVLARFGRANERREPAAFVRVGALCVGSSAVLPSLLLLPWRRLC